MTPSDFAGKMRAAEFEPDERPSHGRKTARKRTEALDVDGPATLLARADEVIE